MSDDESETAESIPYDDAPAVDWLLQKLVRIVNRQPTAALPVILSLHGLVVAGELTSGHHYFTESGKRFRDEDGKSIEAIASAFEKIANDIYADSGDERLPAYAHLRNARVYAPGQPPLPANDGSWWRIRICEVDGFSLGSLGP